MHNFTELMNWVSLRGLIWVVLPLLSFIVFEAACSGVDQPDTRKPRQGR